MFEKVKIKVIYPILFNDPGLIMAFNAFAFIWWGIVFSSFSVEEHPLGQVLLIHLPINAWAFIFFAMGVGLITSRFLFCRSFERIFTLISTSLWGFISATMLNLSFGASSIIGEHPKFLIGFSGGVYTLITIMTAWAYWRLRND